jgi:hypothetical protein
MIWIRIRIEMVAWIQIRIFHPDPDPAASKFLESQKPRLFLSKSSN